MQGAAVSDVVRAPVDYTGGVEEAGMDRVWLADAAERIGWTFVQASIAAVGSEALAVGLAGGDVNVLRAAGVGGLAAVLSLLKAVAARHVGDPDTAATLPSP